MPYRWTSNTCPACSGYGWEADDETLCAQCRGSGSIPARIWLAALDLHVCALARIRLYRTRREAQTAIEAEGMPSG